MASGGVNAGTVRARLTLENGEFRARMQDARQEMRQLQKEANEMKKAQSQMNTALTAVGIGAVATIGAATLTAARFEQSMAKVKAISGATDAEFARLNETAQQLGSTTAFSASQAAEGMTFLSMAGFEANQVIASMPALLNLAGAAQLDLGTSADYLSNIMSGFGISAEDSGHSVDVLVKAMTSANTDLPQLAEAMKYVAPVASAMKFSIEDTAGAIALMSNYGIQGSQAGTSLRAMLLSMVNPVGQAEEAMTKLGISFKDNNGEMKSLPDILDHVKGKMEGLTDAQQTQYAAMLVGTEASSGFLALLNEGGDGLQKFADELRNSDGVAEDFASTMKDTLMGQWTQFMSAVEGLGIKIGEQFLPIVRKLVEAGTSFVSLLSKINPEFMALGLKMAAGASAAGLLFGALSKLPKIFRILQLSMGPMGWLSLGLGALVGGMVSVGQGAEEMSTKTVTEINEMAKANRTLEDQADRFDRLHAKMVLSSDEWARYIDLAMQLPNLTNEESIKKVKDEMALLAEKSGLTNEQLEELVGLNNDLAGAVPDATSEISAQNNVIVQSTDAVRKLTAAKRDELLIEMQIRKTNAEANQHKNEERKKTIQIEMNKLKEQELKLTNDMKAENENLLGIKEKITKAHEDGDSVSALAYEREKVQSEAKLDSLKKQSNEGHKRLQDLQKESGLIEKELDDLTKIDQQMANMLLQQVGLNGKKEDSYRLINDEIIAEGRLLLNIDERAKKEKLTKEQVEEIVKQHKKKLELLGETKDLLGENVNIQEEDKKLTEMQVKQMDDLKKKLLEQGLVLDENSGKVMTVAEHQAKVKEEAEKANKEMAKDIDKKVTVDDKGTNEKNHAEATKKGTKEVKTDDKGSNKKNEKEATKKGEKEVTTKDKGSNNKNHKDATKKGDKSVTTKDNGSNNKNHKEATKQGTKEVTAKIVNLASFMANFNPITMTVNLVQKGASAIKKAITGDGKGKKHSGGTVHELPKYHTGGTVDPQQFGRMATPPKFDEVDVRLLRNEMVLTKAQQANLFRMVSTFGSIAESQTRKQFEGESSSNQTIIQIGQMTVREEADIKKISEELERLSRQRQRSKGVY